MWGTCCFLFCNLTSHIVAICPIHGCRVCPSLERFHGNHVPEPSDVRFMKWQLRRRAFRYLTKVGALGAQSGSKRVEHRFPQETTSNMSYSKISKAGAPVALASNVPQCYFLYLQCSGRLVSLLPLTPCCALLRSLRPAVPLSASLHPLLRSLLQSFLPSLPRSGNLCRAMCHTHCSLKSPFARRKEQYARLFQFFGRCSFLLFWLLPSQHLEVSGTYLSTSDAEDSPFVSKARG